VGETGTACASDLKEVESWETDPAKILTGFVEHLTDAICDTAKWLKSSK
jgi:hypothetical protein